MCSSGFTGPLWASSYFENETGDRSHTEETSVPEDLDVSGLNSAVLCT